MSKLLSHFPAYLRQFKFKSHIQRHPQKEENKSFHLTPILMGFQALLLEIWALKKCPNLFDRPCRSAEGLDLEHTWSTPGPDLDLYLSLTICGNLQKIKDYLHIKRNTKFALEYIILLHYNVSLHFCDNNIMFYTCGLQFWRIPRI